MTLVSLTNSCRLLAIDPKTLHRWMKLCHLSPESHPLDARRHPVDGPLPLRH